MDKKLKTVRDTLLDKLKKFFSHYVSAEGTVQKENLYPRLNSAAKGIGMGVAAFFFGRAEMVFSVNPFGTALLCASGKHLPFIYVGLLISSLFSVGMAIPNFLMYTMGVVLRFIVSYTLLEKKRSPLFAEAMGYRALVSIAMMFMTGLYRCISGGFLWFDFFATVTAMTVTPLLTVIYCGVFIEKNRFTSYHDLGMAALMASCVYSLNDIRLLGFSLSAVLAFGLSLYISKECGMLRGGIAGLISGIAYNVIYAPLFAMTGLISGLLWKTGTAFATVAALIAGVVYGIYMDGFSSLRLLAPDLLAGALIFIPLAKTDLLPRPLIFSGNGTLPDNYADKIAVAQKKDEDATKRFKAMSMAFTSLSRTFYELSNAQKRPEFSKVKDRCRSCFDKYCADCSRNIICWDRQYEDTAEALTKIAADIYGGELITVAHIPEFLSRRCSHISEITEEINRGYSRQLEDAMRGDKAEIFAIDYEAMSKLLEDAIKDNAKEYEIDADLTAKLKSSARYLNLACSNLAAYGKRRKQIIAGGVELARVKMGVEEICRSFERVVGAPLKGPDFSVEKGFITMTMSSRRMFKAESARISAKKENEDINGDCISFFENSEDYFYALLGDGMGSGKDAALASRLATVYLDRMLRSGNKKEQSVAMLNSFLRQKSSESFTTIDLLEVDLLTGEACFIKSGAAPSYILRGSSLFKIASSSIPVGITKKLQAEEVKFKLEENDTVVMISDGIAQTFEDGLWLMDMLTNDWKKGMSCADMCERILEEARERNGDRDDMTVGMVKVVRN